MVLRHRSLIFAVLCLTVGTIIAFVIVQEDNFIVLPALIAFVIGCVAAFFCGFVYSKSGDTSLDLFSAPDMIQSPNPGILKEYVSNSTSPCIVVAADRRILESNSSLENVWGMSKTRLLGAHATFDDQTPENSFWNLQTEEIPIGFSLHRSGELSLNGKVKSSGVFHFTWVAYPNLADRAVLIEIAEPDAANRVAENQNIEMTKAVKLSSNDKTLLKDLNHELRTELQGLLGMIELLRGGRSSNHNERYLHTLEQSTKGVISSVDTFIDFFEIDEKNQREMAQGYSLDQLLSGISKQLNKRSDTDTFEVLYDTDHTVSRVIKFPRDLLEKLICHLVSHIVQNRDDCWIVVRPRIIEEQDKNPLLSIEVVQRAKSDEPKDMIQVHVPRKISLDLEIARRLVSAIGGELIAGQFSGNGIGFKFTTGSFELDKHQSALSVPNYLKNLRALIIDDNPVSREVLQELAREIGWHADVAASGEAALHIMNFKSGIQTSYDIVLVDWRMPDIDGWETSKKIRKEIDGGHLPIIVMISAHNQKFLSKSANERSQILNGFLTKPVTMSMLLDAVIDATVHKYQPEKAVQSAYEIQREAELLAGKKILVVDDNIINQEIARELLKLYGATVVTASGGYAAITTVQTAGHAIDIVLMDIHMPDLDGLSSVKRIRSLGYAELPIVIMTANTSDSTRSECFKAGAQDLVQKPFLAKELVETLLANMSSKLKQPATEKEVRNLSERTRSAAKELGINLEQAVSDLGGSLMTYNRALNSFIAEAERANNYLGNMLDDITPEDIARELHALGGLQAVIGDQVGSERTKTIAEEVVDALHQSQTAEKLAEKCTEFRTALEQTKLAAEMLSSYIATELKD
ncbi:response regulator [Thalassospira sp.]|uniref:response regulator n=1 Tax=Thalassospira sp. TaxID=1912094 RepID=UPI001B21A16E|nr:response regulator [Thalassospira sp.]MBO6839917.1 response regulator [Thalassospira sp.]